MRPPLFDAEPLDLLEDFERTFFRGSSHYHDIRSPLDDIFSTFERDMFRPHHGYRPQFSRPEERFEPWSRQQFSRPEERFEPRGRQQFNKPQDNEIYDV